MAALGLWEGPAPLLVIWLASNSYLVSIEKTLPGVNPDGALPVGGDVDGLPKNSTADPTYYAKPGRGVQAVACAPESAA